MVRGGSGGDKRGVPLTGEAWYARGDGWVECGGATCSVLRQSRVCSVTQFWASLVLDERGFHSAWTIPVDSVRALVIQTIASVYGVFRVANMCIIICLVSYIMRCSVPSDAQNILYDV